MVISNPHVNPARNLRNMNVEKKHKQWPIEYNHIQACEDWGTKLTWKITRSDWDQNTQSSKV